MDKAWKAFERRVANYVGAKGRNLPQLTNDDKRSFDVCTADTIYECKLRAKFPNETEIIRWLINVQKRAVTDGYERGVLCIQHKGKTGFWLIQNTRAGVCWYRSTMPNPFKNI